MDGDALILCEGHYGSTDGKTAHGLVRFTRRYRIRGVIDSTLARRDAGEALDGVRRGIPIVASLEEGLRLPGPPVSTMWSRLSFATSTERVVQHRQDEQSEEGGRD